MLSTTFQTTTISDFLDNFAGRRSMEHYDDAKPVKIAECNRDFVWSQAMQRDFICSILKGFPIPAMCIVNGQIVDGGNRSTTLWLFKNGKITVHIDEDVMDYEKMCTNRTLTRRWDSAVIPQQIVSNASPDQFAQIYENLNKGVKLSFGQLLENRKHRPWVSVAEAMIGRGETEYADRDLLHRVWTASFPYTKGREELAWAYQILVGAEHGPQHFHFRFPDQIQLIMGDSPPTTRRLYTILEMIDACDTDRTVSVKKKKDIFKKFIGAIIYDHHDRAMNMEAWTEKWTEFIRQAYNTLGEKDIKKIINVGNKRATSSSRIQAISENVTRYLEGEFDSDATSYADDDSSDS